MSTPRAILPRPWYREPWPWLLMLPPALSVVGGLVMLYLALSAPPEIVHDGPTPVELGATVPDEARR
jgi:hypothetical protein